MPKKRITYQEGDWFGVPLEGGDYAIGLIARARPPILLGYFFGPRREQLPCLDDLAPLTPEHSIAVTMFGDLGFLKGKWPILGRLEPWDPNTWPIPPFVHIDLISGQPCLRQYSEDNLWIIQESACSFKEAIGLPKDGVSGDVALEHWLTWLVRKQAEDQQMLDHFKSAGYDLTRLHAIQFCFHFSTKEATRRAANFLSGEGLTVEIGTVPDGNNWLLLTQYEMVPTVKAITAIESLLRNIVVIFRGKYNGWRMGDGLCGREGVEGSLQKSPSSLQIPLGELSRLLAQKENTMDELHYPVETNSFGQGGITALNLDRAALEQLQAAGSDLSVPHLCEHYLYFPKRRQALKAAQVLREQGFEVKVDRSADETSWLLLASHQIMPEEDALEEASTQLEEVASSLGGEYDGWEMAVVR